MEQYTNMPPMPPEVCVEKPKKKMAKAPVIIALVIGLLLGSAFGFSRRRVTYYEYEKPYVERHYYYDNGRSHKHVIKVK